MSELQILRTMHPPEIYIEQIAGLQSEVGRSLSPAFLHEKLDALPRADRLLLAVEGELLLGFAHLSVRRDLSGPDAVEIVDLIVRASRRREGIGRRLLNAAETWARQSNHSSLMIRMSVPDASIHAFLSSLHFDQSETLLEFVRAL